MSHEKNENSLKCDHRLQSDSGVSLCHNCDREASEESKESISALPLASASQNVKRKFRTLTFGRRKKSLTCANKCKENSKKKNRASGWGFKLCARTDSCTDVAETTAGCGSCICTGYKRTDEHHLGSGVVFDASSNNSNNSNDNINSNMIICNESNSGTVSHLNRTEESVNHNDQTQNQIYSHIEPNTIVTNYHTANLPSAVMSSVQVRVSELALALRNQLALSVSPFPYLTQWGDMTELTPGFLNRFCLRGDPSLVSPNGIPDTNDQQQIHTQIDYIHCLVPDLLNITNCSFYWGKMDRYEAEKLLENKPEGTFLLRDSAQEEHLFSVSFRRFDRSLHARIEQWNHRFSFDSHDPGVFASTTVCGLIEHYKDPSHCMFFEPMLTIPLHRNFPFSLQHMCRATICSRLAYDTIHQLQLPKRIKNYLKEYHYKQQVRVRRLDNDH